MRSCFHCRRTSRTTFSQCSAICRHTEHVWMDDCRPHVGAAAKKTRQTRVLASARPHPSLGDAPHASFFFSHGQQAPHSVPPPVSIQRAGAPVSSPPPLRTRLPRRARRSRRKPRLRETKRASTLGDSEGGGLTRSWALSGCRRWAHAPLAAAPVTRSCRRRAQAALPAHAAAGPSPL